MKKLFTFILLCVAFVQAMAASATFTQAPNTWRLQDYNSGGSSVTLYYTPSSSNGCASGVLSFPPGTPSIDANRLWSLVASVKLFNASSPPTQQTIFIYYETTTCQIQSFGIGG